MPTPLVAGEYDPETIKAQARAWVDGVNSSTGVSGGWRLQILRLRTRRKFSDGDYSAGPVTDVNGDTVASTGAHSPEEGCDELPARIRRFVPGCPWALVDQAIRYLYEIAPYTGIVYNGVKVEGKYRPTLTQWVRDDQTTVSERGANGTYTLIQDLLEITDCDDSLEVATGASCSASEETTFKWDMDSVEPLPITCEQGVTWSIRAVSRSDEDGTYSYQLVKSVAKTQHYGPVLIECGPQSETTEESWESVYGQPGAFEARGCSLSGSISLPACDTTPGVKTQIQYKENPDCTFSVVVRRRTSKEFSDTWRDGTTCRPQDVTVIRNAKRVPSIPTPDVGERVDRRLQRNEDNSYDVTDTVVRAPTPYSYSWIDGSACRRRSVNVLRAQKTMPPVPSVQTGETLDADIQRNEDCTWDARFAVARTPDPFVHSWLEGSTCRPVRVNMSQGIVAIPEMTPPVQGESISRSLSRNADCTYDMTERIATSSPATATWTDGTCAQRTVHALHENEFSIPNAGAGGVGVVRRASFRRNDDCTYSGEVSTTTAESSSVTWTEGTVCRPTTSVAHWSDPTLNIPAIPQGGALSASVSRNADCTYDYVVKLTPAMNVAPQTWVTGSQCESVTTTTYNHHTGIPSVSPAGGSGAYTRASFRLNDDCTYSGDIEVARSTPSQLTWTEGGACNPARHHWFANQPSVNIPAPISGQKVSASVAKNRDCTYDYQYTVTEAERRQYEQEWESEEESPSHKFTYSHKLITFSHVSEFPTVPRFSNVDVDVSLNDDCTYSGRITAKKLKKWELAGGSGGDGGIGTSRFTRKIKAIVNGVTKTRTLEYQVTVYKGLGNASASTLAHHQQVSGVAGSIIGYDLIDEGNWN